MAYSLSALSAAIYIFATFALVKTSGRWPILAKAAIYTELVGVLAVGLMSYLLPDLFGHPSVWSKFGQGYGYMWWIYPDGSYAARGFAPVVCSFATKPPGGEPLPLHQDWTFVDEQRHARRGGRLHRRASGGDALGDGKDRQGGESGGNEILVKNDGQLAIEEWGGRLPFSDLVPDPVPHRWRGRSHGRRLGRGRPDRRGRDSRA